MRLWSRASCALAVLASAWTVGAVRASQPIGDPLFLSVVRTDGVLVPIAVHNGAEWWGGWPFGTEGKLDDVKLPASLSAVPAEWLPPGLALPSRWTFWATTGEVRPVQAGAFVRTGSVMTMIGLQTSVAGQRSEFERWAGADDEAGFAVAGRAEIGRVATLDETSSDWRSLWGQLGERFDAAERLAIAQWLKERRASPENKNTDIEHPGSPEERRRPPGGVHLTKALRPTSEGTWYHFIAHRTYGPHDVACMPVTTFTGIAVKNSAGRVTVRSFSAFATETCGNSSDTTILATLHWAGPPLWIARENLEDGFEYLLLSPAAADPSSIALRADWAYRNDQPMRAGSVLPRDDAARCNGFSGFRTRLAGIIQRRDVAALDEIVDPAIRSSYQERDGRAAFDRVWRPQAADSRFWSELQAALDLGGRCEGEGSFIAPYVAGYWPHDAPEGSLAVIGRDVPLRQQPNEQSRILSTLDYALVRPIWGPEQADSWRAVDAGNGRRGYIDARMLRSPRGAYFTFTRTGWRLAAFVTD